MPSKDTTAFVDELNDLIQLDFDAVQAYQQAIDRIERDDAEVRADLERFRADHERHITDLGAAIRALGHEPKEVGRDLKGVLLEGMTALRSATGTLGALKAMRMNEKLTNKSYARAAEVRLPLVAREVVARNLDDERRHLAAITAHIARLDASYIEDESEVEVEEESEDLEGELLTEERPGAPV